MPAERAGETAAADRALVDRFVDRRDEASFLELYRRYTPRLYRLAWRFLGSGEETDEVMQEMWIRAARGLGGFEWRSALSTWLAGILLRCCRERRRSAGREAAREADTVAEGWTSPGAGPRRIDLERAVTGLASGFREVLILHDVEGYTHGEIASLLEISVGTSKSQLSRARRAVRARLTPRPAEGDSRDRQ